MNLDTASQPFTWASISVNGWLSVSKFVVQRASKNKYGFIGEMWGKLEITFHLFLYFGTSNNLESWEIA